ETATTIEGNAAMKAGYVRNHFGYDCFADDTGLEVAALDGEPGVYSARYAGEGRSARANMLKLLKNLEGKENRNARFKTVIALTIKLEAVMFVGLCDGVITQEEQGTGGFGYDPIFKPNGSDKTFAEMTLQQKSEIGHRGKAMRQLIDYLTA
ncbi:MAG: RdgB/HAM1 family non-canonical purine NTP pyrophosphatase, partial [Marinirhabdus sp.]|nr:RdgB/HAM1 family non-canonical purine NTP pyrophosphatase [Marinirhabdus sp.]